MVDLQKDWLINPRGRARTEAALAVEELRSGHVQFKDDLPLEIRKMMDELVEGEHVKSLHCQTPMKVRLEVRPDLDD
jgi:hypothetical protein